MKIEVSRLIRANDILKPHVANLEDKVKMFATMNIKDL